MTAEEFWFAPILAFANAEDPERAILEISEAEIVFAAGNNRTWKLSFPAIEDDDVQEDQGKLRKILAALQERGPTRRLWLDIAKKMTFAPISGTVGPKAQAASFKLNAIVRIGPKSLEQWYAYAIAELISQGYGDRVKRCQLHTCQRFFVDDKTKGPPKVYCNTSHASQARVKRKRQRDARR